MRVRYLASAGLGDELEVSARAAVAFQGEGVSASTRLARAGDSGAVRSESEVLFVRTS